MRYYLAPYGKLGRTYGELRMTPTLAYNILLFVLALAMGGAIGEIINQRLRVHSRMVRMLIGWIVLAIFFSAVNLFLYGWPFGPPP